jgi:hypothetical protein
MNPIKNQYSITNRFTNMHHTLRNKLKDLVLANTKAPNCSPIQITLLTFLSWDENKGINVTFYMTCCRIFLQTLITSYINEEIRDIVNSVLIIHCN